MQDGMAEELQAIKVGRDLLKMVAAVAGSGYIGNLENAKSVTGVNTENGQAKITFLGDL